MRRVRGVTTSTQAPYLSPCPGGQVSLIALRLLPPPDPLRWARAGTPLALLHPLPRVREGVGTTLAPTRKVPKRMGSARAVMSSGVRRERREKPDGSLRGPGRVFPQSYGLDRIAHRRGVTSGIRGRSRLTWYLKYPGCPRKGRLARWCLVAWCCGAVGTPPPTDRDETPHGSASPAGPVALESGRLIAAPTVWPGPPGSMEAAPGLVRCVGAGPRPARSPG